MRFVEFFFDVKSISNENNEILMAQLADLGFDSFENTDENLKAYILFEKINNQLLKKIKNNLIIENINFHFKNLENKNWNDVWESNFSPVFFSLGVIRAPFHTISKKLKYNIIIKFQLKHPQVIYFPLFAEVRLFPARLTLLPPPFVDLFFREPATIRRLILRLGLRFLFILVFLLR